MFVVRMGKLKLSSIQCLVMHIHTYSIYREITGLQSFLVQFPSFTITEYLSYMHMVHTHHVERRREGQQNEKKTRATFCLYKRGEMKNVSRYQMTTYARHSDHPAFNFHEILQSTSPYPHYINEETEAWRRCCLLKAKQLGSGCARI